MKPHWKTALSAIAVLLAVHVVAQNPPPGGGDEGGRGRGRGGQQEGHEDHGGPGGPGGPGGFGGRGGGPRMNPLFQALDADKDGEISAAEIANAPKALKALDKNNDGKITQEEVRPNFPEGGRGGPRGANNTEAVDRMMGFDKNGDGKLSAEELPERMRNILERADANKDGFLTRDELGQAMNAMQRPGGGPGGPGGERRGPQAEPR